MTDSQGIADNRELWEMFRKEALERTQRIIEPLAPFVSGKVPEPGEAFEHALEEIRREAHTVKGAAGIMGEKRLYELAERLDYTLRAARAAGALSAETASLLADGARAFAEGAESAGRGEELPDSVETSIEALEPRP